MSASINSSGASAVSCTPSKNSYARRRRALGKVMGREARAEELAKLYEAKHRDTMERVAKAAPARKPVVYVELGQTGADVVGNSYSGTIWGKIVTQLGAVNLADGKLPGPWGPVNAEAVVADDPHHVFIAASSWVGKPKAVKTWCGSSAISPAG